MEEPLSLDVILGEFSEEDTAWVLRDVESGKYVTIPHAKFPGRNIFQFFMSALDANRIRDRLRVESPRMSDREIEPYEVKLKQALRGIAGSGNSADGFVVHTPNEVLDFLWNKG